VPRLLAVAAFAAFLLLGHGAKEDVPADRIAADRCQCLFRLAEIRLAHWALFSPSSPRFGRFPPRPVARPAEAGSCQAIRQASDEASRAPVLRARFLPISRSAAERRARPARREPPAIRASHCAHFRLPATSSRLPRPARLRI